MRINDFEHLQREMLVNSLSGYRNYISLLKVMGNNYKYDFLAQVSIANFNNEATACASFDMWSNKFNRVVKRGEKGIPILKGYGDYNKVNYIFDVSQTVSKDRSVSEVALWKLDTKKLDNILDELGIDNHIEYEKRLYDIKEELYERLLSDGNFKNML